MSESHEESLTAALARYAVELPESQVALLDQYCQRLWEWNAKLNLTRHTDYGKFVSRDLVDSLEISRLLEPGQNVLDVGTGGGVPGIVLAILRPDLRISLCESVGKKARAVEDIVRGLGLTASRASRACREGCAADPVRCAGGPSGGAAVEDLQVV